MTRIIKKPKVLRIVDLLRPHWKAMTMALVGVGAAAAADLLEPWPIKIVLDYALQSRPMPGWMIGMVSRIGGGTLAILNFAVAAVAGIAVVGALSSYLQNYLTTNVGQRIMHDLRRAVYHHIHRLSLAEHDEKRTGDLISRVTSDIDSIQDFVTTALLGIVANILTLLGILGIMLYASWRFTLISLAIAPVLFVIVYFFTRRIKKAARDVRRTESELVSIVQEVFSSIRVVKAFAREDYEQRRFERHSLDNVETALQARGMKMMLSPVVDVVVVTGTCLMLGYGARMVMANELTVGVLVVFLAYLRMMYKPMRDLSKMTDSVSKASVGFERIREILETESAVRDLPRARRARGFKGRIEFEQVSFGYTPDQLVLKDLSFRIEPGQVAAFVGQTGGGKTSIVNLVARFYDPISGTVKVDDTDIRGFTIKSLREQISFVLQETLLFHAPVWQNIAYGRPEARRAEIVRAAELANAHEFIKDMPEGYDTMVGERGVTLSGGQRQRIAIARAVIRDAPILILDEPTSGLDAHSEQAIMEALERLMKNKTSIVIAHHLGTILHADTIFVMKDHQLVEHGTHDELLAAGGFYSGLFKVQHDQRTIEHAL
jgi:ATP-binding cassette, subfamily B, bacterial